MTIALGNSNPVQYAGNASAVAFGFPWKISAATDLIVGFIVGGTYTQQFTGYTVSGIGINGGGTVTFSVAPPLNTTVDLRTVTPDTQPTDFANFGRYLPEDTTNAIDRAVRQIQDLNRRSYTFGVHGPDNEIVPWTQLPSAAARANTVLGFDSNGLPAPVVGIPNSFTQALFNSYYQTAQTQLPPTSVSSAETAAGVTPTLFNIARYKDVPVERYGVVVGDTVGNETVNTPAMARALAVASAASNSGGVIYMPQGVIRVNSTLAVGDNAVNWLGSGKSQTIIKAVGLSLDTPIISINPSGSSVQQIDTIFMRDFMLLSDNGLARGLSASWVKGSEFNLYFYNLYNGAVMSTCFNNKWWVNAFQCGLSTVQLLGTCDQTDFYASRFVGYKAVQIAGPMDTVNFFGGDFEGIIAGGGTWNGTSWSVPTTGGVGLLIQPGSSNAVQNVNCYGVHWEHINGYAIAANGAASNNVAGLNVLGCKIHGGKVGDPNPLAAYAVQLINVLNPVFEGNDFGDWGTAVFQLNGTEAGGRIQNNSNQDGNVSALSNQSFQSGVEVNNNFAGPQTIFTPQGEFAPAFGGATVSLDLSQGDSFPIHCTNGTAFTLNNPINGVKGQEFTVIVSNESGGTMGNVTFDTEYKTAGFSKPSNGQNTSARFEQTAGPLFRQVTSWTSAIPN